ncbi:cobalt transporter CbiQ [Enterococcus florum]|uniref:Cobalt transporter CbiQ n=1 Tax=Enterococcus florum TaxID=2480627 RepID=A0A4P5PJS4_9ENTE|nr:cobalt ECF transporter T component CbiQ [Enterococcus florum]GCF93583.1 cobalt transporter CbiQ [Enterococcus florum]
MLPIDQIAYGNRLLDLSPERKGVAYLCLLLLCFFTNPKVQIGLVLILSATTIYVARVTFRRYLKWLLIPLPFLLISVLSIILSVDSDPAVFLAAIPFFKSFLGISQTLLETAIHLFFRSLSCLTSTYLFVLTVPFQQILYLMKRCCLPRVLIEITMLMYRFIFIFLDEVSVLKKSQEMRFGYRGLKNSYHSLGLLLRVLFQQTFTRVHRMNVSLEMKFFSGDFPL